MERVYWWRLAAHGFGLIDERADPWQPRPAWSAYLHLLRTLGEATFERNLPAPERSFVHLFRRPDGERVAVAYTWGSEGPWQADFTWSRLETRDGQPAPDLRLHGQPLYLRGVDLG